MTFFRLHLTAPKALLVAVALWPGRAAAWAQDKKPVPDAAAQAKAQELIRDVYGKEFEAARTSEERTGLAKKLLDEAAKSKGDPASHFVLLRFAKEVAARGGDAETALEAVDRIIETYEVDPIEMKLECLEAVAEAAKSSSQRATLAEQAFLLVDPAVADDNFEAAVEMGELARESALKAREFSLAKQIVARLKEIEKRKEAYGQYEKAMSRLRESPTDAEANLAAGRYVCLVQGEWDRGIPMLALGSDVALAAVVAKELKGAASAEVQVALGDEWWDLAQTKEGRERDSFLLRAGHWYQQAQADVTSALVKAKLQQRLEEIAKIERPAANFASARPRAGRQAPLAVAPFDSKRAKAHQSAWSRHLGSPIVLVNSVGMKLVLIPPGEFDMGCTQEEIFQLLNQRGGATERHMHRVEHESPPHRVKITRPYYLGLCEVTQAEYQRVMGANPSQFQAGGGGAPVENVSWSDAVEFCRRLSELPEEKASGHVYQLPTEAEWEYACRAGTTMRFYFGWEVRQLGYYAWFRGNAANTTHPVGQRMPNAWGLYDMLGNVWEWCADWYGNDFYKKSGVEDPSGPSTGNVRVIRGGAWQAESGYFGSAHRGNVGPENPSNRVGFRVAMTLAP